MSFIFAMSEANVHQATSTQIRSGQCERCVLFDQAFLLLGGMLLYFGSQIQVPLFMVTATLAYAHE